MQHVYKVLQCQYKFIDYWFKDWSALVKVSDEVHAWWVTPQKCLFSPFAYTASHMYTHTHARTHARTEPFLSW